MHANLLMDLFILEIKEARAISLARSLSVSLSLSRSLTLSLTLSLALSLSLSLTVSLSLSLLMRRLPHLMVFHCPNSTWCDPGSNWVCLA